MNKSASRQIALCCLLLAPGCGEEPPTVLSEEPRPPSDVALVRMQPAELYMDSLGTVIQARARALSMDGELLFRSEERPELFSWSSSAPDVLSADQRGLLSGVGWGTATVSATFRGDLRGTMRVKIEDAVDLAWATPLGRGRSLSNVAIGPDGTIFVAIQDDASGTSSLSALSPQGGALWTSSLPHTNNSHPAVGTDGTLYVGSWLGSGMPGSEGQLIAIDPHGAIKWVQDQVGRVGTSPAIGIDGTIYVAGGRRLHAVDSSGDIVWTHEALASLRTSPAIGADGTIYVGGVDGVLYAINLDGSRRWSFETGGLVQSSPAIGRDGTIYFGSEDGRLYAVHPDGSEQWSLYLGRAGIGSSPVIGLDNTIYIVAGSLYAISTEGIIRWSYAAGHSGAPPSPVIGGDGTVYFGSFRGVTALGQDGSIKWIYTISEEGFGGAPAIGHDGTIVVASHRWDSAGQGGQSTLRALVENLSSNGGYSSAPWPTGRSGPNNSGRPQR